MPENQLKTHKARHNFTSVGKSTAICQEGKCRCIKYGMTKARKQRFRCLSCKRTFLANYKTWKLSAAVNNKIKTLLSEGCSIRSIGRILKISTTTIIRRIRIIAAHIKPPAIPEHQTFELDELYTFIGSKKTPTWIAYAINRNTREVVAFSIGNRSNQMLSQVTEPLLNTFPLRIFTDKLVQYKSLIPSAIHCTKKYGINHIERKNLTLRTHLKRLNRRTICFSRSAAMLEACLMIYFFG